MNIRAKLDFLKKRDKKVRNTQMKSPVCTEVRTQSLSSLYSYKDFLIDLVRYCTINQGLYHPYLPALIVEFVPLYNWLNPEIINDLSDQKTEECKEVMNVGLSHCNTVISNSFQKFGAVLGSKLDPRLDHVINVKLVEGVEFGVGICDESHLNKSTTRDFMCIEGGYGYYNYKTKSPRMKPKYPPGLYYQVKTCRKIRNEADIFRAGDVLTLVIQRENAKTFGRGINLRSRFGVARDLKFNPMNNLKASSRYSLSFYKNGEDMGFHLRNLNGQFSLCLNYYLTESKIRLLSDYNFKKIYRNLRNRQRQEQISQMTNEKSAGSSGSDQRENGSVPSGSSTIPLQSRISYQR